MQKAWQVNGTEYEPNSRVFEVDLDIIKEAAEEQPRRKKLTQKPPRRKRGAHDLEGLADALAGIIDDAPPSASKSEVKPKIVKQSAGAGTSKSASKSKGNSCIVGRWQLRIARILDSMPPQVAPAMSAYTMDATSGVIGGSTASIRAMSRISVTDVPASCHCCS